MARSNEGNRSEQPEDSKSHRGVAPRPPKRARKFIRKEVRDTPAALGIRAVDAAVRANDEAVEIVDEPRITRLSPRDREVRCRATIDAAQLAHLFAVQLAQRHPIQKLKQIFKPLPDVLALVDEAIQGHCQLPIANFRFAFDPDSCYQ